MKEKITGFIIVGIWTFILSWILISAAILNKDLIFATSTWGGVQISIAVLWLITRFGLFAGIKIKVAKKREIKLSIKYKSSMPKEEMKWQNMSVQDREKELSLMSKAPIYTLFAIGLFILIIGLAI